MRTNRRRAAGRWSGCVGATRWSGAPVFLGEFDGASEEVESVSVGSPPCQATVHLGPCDATPSAGLCTPRAFPRHQRALACRVEVLFRQKEAVVATKVAGGTRSASPGGERRISRSCEMDRRERYRVALATRFVRRSGRSGHLLRARRANRCDEREARSEPQAQR